MGKGGLLLVQTALETMFRPTKSDCVSRDAASSPERSILAELQPHVFVD